MSRFGYLLPFCRRFAGLDVLYPSVTITLPNPSGIGGALKKAFVHCGCVVICGILATFGVVWYAAGSPRELQLKTYSHGTAAVLAKLSAADRGWAKSVSVDETTQTPQVYYAARDNRQFGLFVAQVCRYPVSSIAATGLREAGATRGTIRSDSLGGEPPDSLIRMATRTGRPDQICFIVYWGWIVPLVRCDIVISSQGIVEETGGLAVLGQGKFLPYAPIWLGFPLSVLLLGGLLWGAFYGIYRLITAAITRKYRDIHERYHPAPSPTVACPSCGYTRKGLASIDACPECGHSGPQLS